MRQALAGSLFFFVLLGGMSPRVLADELGAGIYFRTDSDQTQVISPYAHGRVRLGERVYVDARYAADIWTGASIDVRTAATKAITEQRDEISAGLEYEFNDFTLGGGYRLSVENDYTSHSGNARGLWKFAQNNATLRASVSYSQDSVGRSGDDTFSAPASTLGLNAAFTQNLTPKLLMQFGYSLTRREGYLQSPYRFVGVGGDGQCGGTAQLCVPERHPTIRLRHAAVVRARGGFASGSLGGGFRFYIDDWGIRSYTVPVDYSIVISERFMLNLAYRFYLQNGASWYQSTYAEEDAGPRWLTRDRELSPLMSHRMAISGERSFDLTRAGPELRVTAVLSVSRFRYFDFVGLDAVWALDATIALDVIL